MAYAQQFLHNFEIPSFFFICDFIDVDECQGNHFCHENANCTNTIGSHVCNCQLGYTGDGQNCTGDLIHIRAVHMYVDGPIEKLQGEFRNNSAIEISHQRTT